MDNQIELCFKGLGAGNGLRRLAAGHAQLFAWEPQLLEISLHTHVAGTHLTAKRKTGKSISKTVNPGDSELSSCFFFWIW